MIRNFHVNFKNGRETLENYFKKEFHDRCLTYITKTLAYSKLSDQNLEGSSSILDESILVLDIKIYVPILFFSQNDSVSQDNDTNRYIYFENREKPPLRLNWSLIDAPRDEKVLLNIQE